MVIGGNSQSLSTYHPHMAGVSYGHSGGPQPWPLIRATQHSTYCFGEFSQVPDPAKRAASSFRDLTDSTGQIQVKGRPGHTQQHQSDETKMNKGYGPLVKKSGINAITPVPRLCNQKQEAEPPKDLPSFAKGRAISRSWTLMPLMKKKVETQLPKSPPDLVENGGTSAIVASKNAMQKKGTAQPPKYPAGFVKNTETRRILASKHVIQKKETAQPPRDPAGLVKNIGTSRISASMQNMQKAVTCQSPRDSAALVKKSETTARIPALKQFTRKGEKAQSSKSPSPLVSKSETGRNLPSCEDHIVWGEQRICEDHIVWEGFVERIVSLGRSCLLCDGDLANETEYNADVEHLNPAGNAVLSCGHAFHSLCLLYATPEEKSRDPPCVICASILS
ncbi:hypothetical protein DITRI_Ditri10aG0171000 [Diplodiscus trichospermus]